MGFHAMIGNSVHGELGKLTYFEDDKLPRVSLESFLFIGDSPSMLQWNMKGKVYTSQRVTLPKTSR